MLVIYIAFVVAFLLFVVWYIKDPIICYFKGHDLVECGGTYYPGKKGRSGHYCPNFKCKRCLQKIF